ncbi:glycosyltransferase family 2 protein [Selenomonas ruminantium]|uniref:glycosyltransferase family 2 protein n=1 Tax=Selenomonas ruminantium TaxID=971 RepID=UPI00047B7B99|nr:glycosyltransferase family 2 protein [Selenomonas ruminantium]
MSKIIVFIPAYNCEKQLPRVLGQFDENILRYIEEIVVVNNLSTDDTESVAINYSTSHPHIPITVMTNKENYNLGGSHKVAFNYAIEHGYDYVLVLHGDDQASIKDIIPIIEDRIYKNYDALLGARFMSGAKLHGYSFLRKWGNIGFNILYSLVTRKRIYDLGSGINMFSMSAMRKEQYEKLPDSLGFNNCLLLLMCYSKMKLKFFPITWREDDQVSNLKLWNFGLFNLHILKEYLLNAKQFFMSDMRSKKIDSYDSEIVYCRGEK